MNFCIVTNDPSEGAAHLRDALTALGHHVRRTILNRGQRIPPVRGQQIINWGSGNSDVIPLSASNNPTSVRAAANKLAFFKGLRVYDVPNPPRVPEWASDTNTAQEWLDNEHIVVARTVLTGHSGEGIVIIENPVDFVEAPLYTKYVKKAAEYRVHFGFGNLFDVQRKALRNGFGNPNHKVRTHNNGFVYVRKGVEEEVPDDVIDQARRMMLCTSLNHGAIDIIYNRRQERAYVLEVNTAPGIEGLTAVNYARMFHEWAARQQ